MKSLSISSLLLFLAISFPLWGQDQPAVVEVNDDASFVALGKELGEVVRRLRAFQPDEAHQQIETSNLPKPLKQFFKGWAYHQDGDYEKAASFFAKVNKDELGSDAYFGNRLDELSKTAEALQSFSVYETENFSFRFQEGPDKVMLQFLPEILEQVYAKYSTLFHYVRDKKIIVELMPDHHLFSYASALSRSQIETTGTIALCVENRLVVLTPRRVAQGYYWPDVIAHEFVHYILTKLSGDNVPLWMQEGVAKYFETRWERDDVNPLDPALESSLAKAIKADSLITVEQMMPSFAALPTAELARQAYAQTTSMIDYLADLKTEDVVQRIVVGLRDDENMDHVMLATIDRDFADFERDWRAWIKTQAYREHAHIADMGVDLLDSDQPRESLEAIEEIDKEQKKHIRLGDLLLERNRFTAALKQYKKTIEKEGPPSRQIVLRMLQCHGSLTQHQEIVDLIESAIFNLENDPTMLLYKAKAYLGMENAATAEQLLERIIRINPFNPEVFQLMIALKEKTGGAEAAEKYREALSALTMPGVQPSKETKS